MTPLTDPDALTPLPTLLAEPLAEVYRNALATQFVGSTVEDWLAVRRLLEGGWTLAMILEACEGAMEELKDAVDHETAGIENLESIVNGKGKVE